MIGLRKTTILLIISFLTLFSAYAENKSVSINNNTGAEISFIFTGSSDTLALSVKDKIDVSVAVTQQIAVKIATSVSVGTKLISLSLRSLMPNFVIWTVGAGAAYKMESMKISADIGLASLKITGLQPSYEALLYISASSVFNITSSQLYSIDAGLNADLMFNSNIFSFGAGGFVSLGVLL